jgi:N-methylhydantoinase B/oxoprolinase/acetone carboxylase alpha subunit
MMTRRRLAMVRKSSWSASAAAKISACSLVTLKLNADDILTMRLPGGGGYHSPLTRNPNDVRDDVLEGFVSPAAARSVYGVALSGPDNAVDLAATKSLRQQMQTN